MFLTKCCIAAMLPVWLGQRVFKQCAKHLFQTYCMNVISNVANSRGKNAKTILSSPFHVISETICQPDWRIRIMHYEYIFGCCVYDK
jgi:hypothetical protein